MLDGKSRRIIVRSTNVILTDEKIISRGYSGFNMTSRCPPGSPKQHRCECNADSGTYICFSSVRYDAGPVNIGMNASKLETDACPLPASSPAPLLLFVDSVAYHVASEVSVEIRSVNLR